MIAAIDRAIGRKSTYNIRVINLSVGRAISEKEHALDPLCQAVDKPGRQALRSWWRPVTKAAKKRRAPTGHGTIASPGNDPYVITVGAMKAMNTNTRSDDQIASYSSKGPTGIDHIAKPDLVAPGNHVVAAIGSTSHLRVDHRENRCDRTMGRGQLLQAQRHQHGDTGGGKCGALMLEKDASLTPDQIKARLMKSATKSFPSSV